MIHEEAVRDLQEGNIRERLSAARFFARFGQPSDRELLRQACLREDVSLVRSVLESALAASAVPWSASGEIPADLEEEPSPGEDVLFKEALAVAYQEVTERLIHELKPVIGRLRLYAPRELAPGSRMFQELDRLQSMVRAIGALGAVSASPTYSEFELANLLDGEVLASSESHDLRKGHRQENSDSGEHRVEQIGPSPLVVTGDADLVRVVVANALKNALEASSGVRESVVLTWNSTDRDYWIAIIDRGPGLPSHLEHAFEIGTTTKAGHLGMGLALAERAAQSLRGTLALTSELDGTTRFEFRWPRPTR